MARETIGARAEESAEILSRDPRVAWEGCSVLLDINDGDRLVFARLSPNATVKIGDKKCLLKPLIGCRFGSLFRVETGSKGSHLALSVRSSSPDGNDMNVQVSGDVQLQEELKDNRSLLDNNMAQGLSSEDIDAMRREGARGDEIVEALIANSSTFGHKTAFSQEKYKLKKQKKYAPKVLLRRPCTRSICEAYFKKHPARIGFLRLDTLSLLLAVANISAYSDVLVVDMVGGILTGAVAERLGGTGYVCSTYFGLKPDPLDIVRIFNFNSECCSRIVRAPFSDLCPAQDSGSVNCRKDETVTSSEIQSTTMKISLPNGCASSTGSTNQLEDQGVHDVDSSLAEQSMCSKDACPTNGVLDPLGACSSSLNNLGDSKVHKSFTPGHQASPEAINSWRKKGFTSLIVAIPDAEVESIVQELLPLLSYSAPFAIYHQYLQPLATCMHKLQMSKLAIGLQLSEPWLREYQVLPSRTHPRMQMSAFGGYILSGIKIHNNDASAGKQ